MSTLELDVPSAPSTTPPVSNLRSPLGSPRHHKRQLTLTPPSSVVSLFASASAITPTRQTSSPPALGSNHTAASSSPSPTSGVHSTSLRSLYRRISSRLPSSSSATLNTSYSTPMLMSLTSHKTTNALPLPPTPALAPASSTSSASSFSHYPSAPLPLSTLRLLAAHSTYLASMSTHMSMLASFLYLVLNLLKASYHSYRHSVHVVVWCDVLLVGVNLLGVGCAMGYWCSYAERRRYEWEWERRRTGKVMDADGVEGQVDGDGFKGQTQEDMDEDDLDITEGEVQSLLMQHSPTTDEALSAAESAPLPTELYPLSNLSAALHHLFSAFTLTLFFSHTFYVSTLSGVTELLSLIGAFLYLLSSLFPLVLDTHIFSLQEETEATLDEFGYVIDSLAMTIYVISSLLYLRLYYRDRAVGDALVWLDGGFWSNVWNVGGSFCYLFAIGYGLSIRLYMSSVLPPTPASSMQPATMGLGLDGGMGMNGSMVDGTVAADDLSDLSEWQRALFGLRSGEKLMTSTGDLMYMMCAVMMEIAERQDRRRRMRGRKYGASMAGGKSAARTVARADGAGIAETDGVPKWDGRNWSETEKPGTGSGIIDVRAT